MKKYDIHRWKDGELNEMLMEKWGYKKKVVKEAAQDAESKEGDEEEVNERRRTADRMRGRPKGSGREKVSEVASAPEMASHKGIPMVPAGDVEGMANAAIAAIVQLAAEAGIEMDVTTGEEALPDEFGDEEPPIDDLGAEAGEEELLSPEDL